MTKHDAEIEQFDKLVRDRIPAIIEENGETPTVSRVSGEAYTERLVEKLHEEVAEYAESREQKAEECGRFADGIVLERVESPAAEE